MKKLNKKGFTIVELVIVIAVIAILAGVLIPTFSSIIKKANASKAQQTANAEFKEALIECLADDGYVTAYDSTNKTGDKIGNTGVTASGDNFVIETKNFKFTVTAEGELKKIEATGTSYTSYNFDPKSFVATPKTAGSAD